MNFMLPFFLFLLFHFPCSCNCSEHQQQIHLLPSAIASQKNRKYEPSSADISGMLTLHYEHDDMQPITAFSASKLPHLRQYSGPLCQLIIEPDGKRGVFSACDDAIQGEHTQDGLRVNTQVAKFCLRQSATVEIHLLANQIELIKIKIVKK